MAEDYEKFKSDFQMLRSLDPAFLVDHVVTDFMALVPEDRLEDAFELVSDEWLNSGNEINFRLYCLQILRFISTLDTFNGREIQVDFWIEVYKSDNQDARGHALIACNGVNHDSVWQMYVRAAESDSHPFNRIIALEGIGTIAARWTETQSRAIETLQQFSSGSEIFGRLGSIYGLGFIHTPQVQKLLLHIVNSSRDEPVIVAAFAMLAIQSDSKDFFDWISAQLHDEDNSVDLVTKLLALLAATDEASARIICKNALSGGQESTVLGKAALNLVASAGISGVTAYSDKYLSL